MIEPTPGTVQSVRQRLLNRARERREEFQHTLVRFGVERFLYRLSCSPYAGRYVVKGATLFTVWLDEPHRPTRDLDLAGLEERSREELEAQLREVFDQDCPEDGLVFDSSSLALEAIRRGQQDQGLEARFVAHLGKAKIPLQLDVGFGDVINPPPQVEDFPTLLDLPKPRVKLYPKETFIAEKFEAMVRFGRTNSRLKDFSDVAFLASHDAFDGAALLRATKETFARRSTPTGPDDRPAVLRTAFYSDDARIQQWQALAEENPLVEELGSFSRVGELLISFLGPLWGAMARRESWVRSWQPPGPWASI